LIIKLAKDDFFMITPERWQHVKELFHSALEREPEERASFLSEASNGDEAIRREVESLLAANETDESFLNTPAYELAAEMLAEDTVGLLAGQVVGHYTILSSLGIGGMGEVYLAQDTRLGRKIALKILPTDFAKDERRVRRFEQEARTASALNHPNICVIHEIGRTEDGRHFIAMEHVDGITLRQRMAQKRLKVSEVLDVATQVASALAAAHAMGIVHRDIKPENIMLRRDGYVKVLDFGLAKLNDTMPRRRNIHEASTMARVHTEPGMLMGTVKYMSPEQLREQSVDERTDIWSLGVVLHEMAAGITPFEAPTTNDTIALILERQSPEFAFSDEVPADFQHVIKKALGKNRAERYQSAKDLASDLKQLRHEMRRQVESAAAPDPSTQRTLSHRAAVSGLPETEPGRTGSPIISKVRSQAVWTAELILSEIREHPKAAIFTGATAILAILLLLIPRQPSPTQSYRMTPLTNAGKSVCAAISPDGKSVAHAEDKEGMQELLVTSIATAGTSVVVAPGKFTYRGLTFSRDGNYLYFTRSEGSEAGILYQVALPGSAPRKMKEGVDSPVTFSPTGDRFAFVRFKRASNEYFLVLANIDGSGERTIATRRDGNSFSVSGPAWSPDEKTIVCAAGWWDHGYHMNLVEIDVADEHEKAVSQQQWFFIYQVAWLEDKSSLIISAREQWTSPFQLWRVSYPQGTSARITNDRNEYESVSLSRDGNMIVSVQSQQVAQIWVAPDGDVQRARPIASTVGYRYGLAWTSKGKIVFSSMAGNNENVSVIDPDGSNQTQLTANSGDNYTPATSPDGRYIVFASNRTGTLNIWRMNAEDGSDPKQLTFSDGNSYPSCSPDGQWVVYDNQSKARTTVWKVSIDGGNPIQLTDEYARMPIVSPDGQFIACRYYDDKTGQLGIAILPFQGGAPIKRLPIRIMNWQRVQWTADGRALTYVDSVKGTQNIWSYDLGSQSSKQLTDFKANLIFAYAWSSDYRQLACQHGTDIRDVTIINNQR
jgi:Tol biopolymer transport system component/predicted Ser/Thr protein kinase